MALTDSEIARCKHELRYTLMTANAEPWIGVTQAFELVIQPYLGAGASTTSSTTVTAASTPTPVSLTLVSGTGFSVFSRAVVDVDDRQEIATIQNVVSNVITLLLSKAHSGTYPVLIEGGESIVREILRNIASVKQRLATSFGAGALKQVDEIHFYGSNSATLFGNLGGELKYWRCELSSALGIDQNEKRGCGGSGTLSVY